MKFITAVVNNPIFIEIQYNTLKKYVKGDYEYIVFNDCKKFPDYTNDGDITLYNKIRQICDLLNIKCIDIPNDHHKNSQNASIRTADSMNFILRYQIENPDKYLLLDSDMFLIKEIDVNHYENYNSAIVLQRRDIVNPLKNKDIIPKKYRNPFNIVKLVNKKTVEYFWNGIYYFDIPKMKDLELLNWNCCPDCDTGGMMIEWLLKNKNNNIYFIPYMSSGSWDLSSLQNINLPNKIIEFLISDPRNQNNKFFCELYDDHFLHYRAGGNWMNQGLNLHNTLSKKLRDVLL